MNKLYKSKAQVSFEQAVEDQCKSNNQKACSSYEASNEIYYDSHKKRETEKEAYLN